MATTQENKPPTQGTRQWTFTTPRWRCGSILLPSLNAGVPEPTGGRHNRSYIFCPGSFGYCKHRFIPTQYVFMFWNRNLVFKLTTIDVPSGLQARNFPSSVIHHHEFSLIGKFNVYTCIRETLFEKPNWVIWILAGNCLTMVTSISGHDLLSWHRPHTKNIKSFCNYVTSIDVNQFGSFICYIMIDININIFVSVFLYMQSNLWRIN